VIGDQRAAHGGVRVRSLIGRSQGSAASLIARSPLPGPIWDGAWHQGVRGGDLRGARESDRHSHRGLVIGLLEQLLGMVNSNLKEGITFFFILISSPSVRPASWVAGDHQGLTCSAVLRLLGSERLALVAPGGAHSAHYCGRLDDPSSFGDAVAPLPVIVTLGLGTSCRLDRRSRCPCRTLCGRRPTPLARLARLGLLVLAERPAPASLSPGCSAPACGTLAARQGPLSRHGDDRVRLHGRGDSNRWSLTGGRWGSCRSGRRFLTQRDDGDAVFSG